MRKFMIVLACLLMVSVTHAQQAYNAVSATATQHSDGQWYLVLSGDSVEISRICAYGDCGRGSGSLIDALNYWYTILGASKGISIAPIPQPMQASAAPSSAVATGDHRTPLNPCRQPYCNPICSTLPVGLSCPMKVAR